ncbi:hypothetical protein CYD90_29530, partial [Klebsiella pneumoniae]
WLMMSLWDALRMNMMISYQELVRTFPNAKCLKERYGISDEKIEEVRAKLHDLNRKVGLY